MRTRVAVVGIGAMGTALISVLRRQSDIEVVAAADIDPVKLSHARPYLTTECLITTNPIEVLKKEPSVLVESTTSVTEAATLVRRAIDQGIHVLLMNSEVDQTFGYLLAKQAEAKGVVLSSDIGDQPGVLARLIDEVSGMGFEVVMAANNKGFPDRYANPDSIIDEAAKRQLSLKQCTSYTDGTKLAIEMALIANAYGYGILATGMKGPKATDLNEALSLFNLEQARQLGGVVDYVLGAQPGGSVFVVGYMNYYKMGEGPFYLFVRPFHLCHFETPNAIRRIVKYHEPVLNQKMRVLNVTCRAKIDIPTATRLDGIGGYHLYGILEKSGDLPIGLVEGAVLKKTKKKDERIGWEDVEFPDGSIGLRLWEEQNALPSRPDRA